MSSNSGKYHVMRSASDDAPDVPNAGFRSAFNISVTGEIQHEHRLADQVGELLFSEKCSDVTLIVEDTRFPAHKVILSARSTYFWAMFYGGMRESTSAEVRLLDTPVQAFRVLLKYIYCGRIHLGSMNFDLVVDVLGLVHKYNFTDLETAISDYLKSVLNHRSACIIYSAAHLYSISGLEATCLDFFDNYSSETLSSPGFLQLGPLAFMQLIERNSFCAPELEIFNAVVRWIEAHPEESYHFPQLLKRVRLPLIKLDDLLNVVRPTGYIPPDMLLDAINDQHKKKSSDLVYRGYLMPNQNVVSESNGAKVLTGEIPTALLLASNRSSFEKFTHHSIIATDPGIIVELGHCYIINQIQLWLFDRDQGMYSYYVEVSVDHEDWTRVADYTSYLCRGRQKIFFSERVVKYIRVMGTHNCNTIPGRFNLVSVEAAYSTEPFEIDPMTLLMIPHYNVATIPNNAIVVEGVSRSRNSLLNGDAQNYDWDNGYTCHELGSSSIIVQLPQPYLIDSMRLLLWDCDNRTYSFYIEVSGDKTNWTKVVEVVQGRSWQTLRFNRVPVVFIRIVGTYNSANEVFHCVHFECPAMVSKEEIVVEPQLTQIKPIDTSSTTVAAIADEFAEMNLDYESEYERKKKAEERAPDTGLVNVLYEEDLARDSSGLFDEPLRRSFSSQPNLNEEATTSRPSVSRQNRRSLSIEDSSEYSKQSSSSVFDSH